MVVASPLPLHLMSVLVILLLLLVSTQADRTISLRSTLYANNDNATCSSHSGDFAFGFRKYPGQENQFLLAIWFAKIPDPTIVWSTNASDPIPRDSKLELTAGGQIMVTSPRRGEVWATANTNLLEASNASMLDTGNFVIRGKNPSVMIWESFRNPSNTILPNQVLNVGDELTSGQILGSNFSRGKFKLALLQGQMVLRQVEPETSHSYGDYESLPNVTQLFFSQSGDIFTKLLDNSTRRLNSQSFPISGSFYLRPTLDFDGTFTRYARPKDASANESWSIISIFPDDICRYEQSMGSGPCGFNSYCEINQFGKPTCGCPPGFSFLDQNNQYSGCKQNDAIW